MLESWQSNLRITPSWLYITKNHLNKKTVFYPNSPLTSVRLAMATVERGWASGGGSSGVAGAVVIRRSVE
jgi:hypothetical protein